MNTLSGPPWAPVARCFTALLAALVTLSAHADEAAIRKNLAERLPNLPKIDEVSKTPMAGLYEIRIGNDVYYSDENGDYWIEGSLVDTRTKTDLTEARVAKLTAIPFNSLPLKDAMMVKQGTGARRMVIFADPNCPYCKHIEQDLAKVKDVTIYTFLLPILSADSTTKSKDIWCAKDAMTTWRAWMIDGVQPPKAPAKCDTSVLERNLALGQKYRVQGTPAVVFEDGSRAPGAIPVERIEQLLQAASGKKS